MRKKSESKDKAARWLTSVPENSKPLEVATVATREIAEVVGILSNQGRLEDFQESLQTILAAMYTSAGVKYPDGIDLVEAPTEEDVASAYEMLEYLVDMEYLVECLECLLHHTRRAMDVINVWHRLCYPEDDEYDDDDEQSTQPNLQGDCRHKNLMLALASC